MLYNKIENTYILDVDDAILLYGKKEYNRLKKSGDLYYVTMQSLKPKKEQKARPPRSQQASNKPKEKVSQKPKSSERSNKPKRNRI